MDKQLLNEDLFLKINWFRLFCDENNIDLKMLKNDIFPNTAPSTLINLWYGRYRASGPYRDALRHFSKAHKKGWAI